MTGAVTRAHNRSFSFIGNAGVAEESTTEMSKHPRPLAGFQDFGRDLLRVGVVHVMRPEGFLRLAIKLQRCPRVMLLAEKIAPGDEVGQRQFFRADIRSLKQKAAKQQARAGNRQPGHSNEHAQ